MSDSSHNQPMSFTGVTASFTTLIICITSFIPASWLTDEAKLAIPILAGLISPYFAAWAIRGFRKVNMDPALIDFITRLESDLARQNKLLLETPDLSAETKAHMMRKRDATLLRLASAQQDYSDGSVSISNNPPA